MKIKATLADGVDVANRKLKKIMQKQIPFTKTPDPVDNTGDVKTSAFPGSTTKDYTEENPYDFAANKSPTDFGRYTAALGEGKARGLKDSDYVKFYQDGEYQVGTWAEFKEAGG